MKSRLITRVLVALGMSTALCAAPAESRACCLFGRSQTAYYAPAPYVAALPVAPACNTCNYAPPACSTCNYAAPACNTCNYVPQVSYRSVFTSVPVTAYRPITTVNQCTGCPTTVVQPVTAYRMQPSLVPVTTYRPVAVSYAPACPTGACGGAVAAPIASTYYAPAAPAAPACSTCNGGGAYVPSAPSTLGTQGTVVPSLPQNTPVPMADPTSSNGVPSTFRPSTALAPAPLNRPIPDPNGASGTRNSNTIVPPTTDPQDRQTARPRQDRLTARPIQSEWNYQPASLRVTMPTTDAPVEQVNWHAAGR